MTQMDWDSATDNSIIGEYWVGLVQTPQSICLCSAFNTISEHRYTNTVWCTRSLQDNVLT